MNEYRSRQPGPLHLTDEQFAECALGLGACDEAAGHLAACAECSAELVKFTSTMEEFSGAALAWSESRSPMSLQQHTRRTPERRSWLATASYAMAAGLIVTVGASMLTHRSEAGPAPVASVTVAAPAVDNEAEIAKDNELMRNVNTAIGQNVPSPVTEYRLDASYGRGRRVSESRSE